MAVFFACAHALLPEYLAWAKAVGHSFESLLANALHIAEDYAVSGREPKDATQLFRALEEATPDGDSGDEASATFAQDCWICADVCIRILVESAYKAGVAIEYALEPTVNTASEELFGVSQVGSGEHEDQQSDQLLRHPSVVDAVAFVRWAVEYLGPRPSLSADDLNALRARARVLTPHQPN